MKSMENNISSGRKIFRLLKFIDEFEILNNAIKNNVEKQLDLYFPQEQPEQLSADVLVANILAEPLRLLSSNIKKLLKPNGKIALSGILDTQVENVSSYYQDELQLEPFQMMDEWCLITGSKK